LYRCNENGEWEQCPGTTFPGGPTEYTITITKGTPAFDWICWRALTPLVVNQVDGVVEGYATIQAGGIGCLTAHRVPGVVPITVKNLTTGKEMVEYTDAEGYLHFRFPLADCAEGRNEFQLASDDITSEVRSIDISAEGVAIGKIISCPTEVPAGNYGVLRENLKVPVRVQNQGTKTGEFRVYFMNLTTGKKEDVDPPDDPIIGWWDNIGPGEVKEYTLESSSLLTEGMELEMQLWQQQKWESGGEPDDVVKISVVEVVPKKLPLKKVMLYGGLALGLYASGSIASKAEQPTIKNIGTVAKAGAVIPAVAGAYHISKWIAGKVED